MELDFRLQASGYRHQVSSGKRRSAETTVRYWKALHLANVRCEASSQYLKPDTCSLIPSSKPDACNRPKGGTLGYANTRGDGKSLGPAKG
jgi:hypothetical protein